MENEFLYKNCIKIDLHGMTRDEALAEIIYQINLADSNVDGIVFVHGYHGGRVLKNLVRLEFNDERIEKKVFVSASATAFKLKN